MNNPFVKKPSPIDEEVTRLLSKLNTLDPESEDYTKAVANLKVLMEARGVKSKSSSVSPDMMLSVAANLAGLLIVLNYERLGIITSKAFGMIFNKGPKA
jgi:hypothetical protein